MSARQANRFLERHFAECFVYLQTGVHLRWQWCFERGMGLCNHE